MRKGTRYARTLTRSLLTHSLTEQSAHMKMKRKQQKNTVNSSKEGNTHMEKVRKRYMEYLGTVVVRVEDAGQNN